MGKADGKHDQWSFPDFQRVSVLHRVNETAKRCNWAVHKKLRVPREEPDSLQVENKREQPHSHVPYTVDLKRGPAAHSQRQPISCGLLSFVPADKTARKAAVA